MDGATRRRRATLSLVLAATLLLGAYAALRLGVNTDHKLLISEELEFQQSWHELAERFPTLDDAILVLLEGDPTRTREAAAQLAERLERESALFSSVFVPGGDPFFEQHGLLYLSVDELDLFVNELLGIQPLLAELARDRSLQNLARLVRSGLEQDDAQSSEQTWRNLLDALHSATVSVYQEPPVSVPWERLLLEGSRFDPEPLRVVVAEPVLDFDRVLPAARATQVIRDAVGELGLTDEPGLEVRLTGNPVLNHQEMLGLAWDLGFASLLSLVLVSVVLEFAFRSWRIVVAAALTLVAGLVWTAAFAAAAIGQLNVVSVAFAVLFVGLGVDFSIHLGAHYTAVRREDRDHGAALRVAVRRVGGALVLCTLSTAIGFYSFLPTDFRGVAELGLVAGTGMFVILFLTFTLFPVLLGEAPVVAPVRARDPASAIAAALRGLSRRHPAGVVTAAAVLALVACLLAGKARFDANVIEMRDPDTESVEAFEALLSRPDASPWSLDVLVHDGPTARALADRFTGAPGVLRTISLADYVPSDQPEKLALLEEASLMLYLPEPEGPAPPLPAPEQIAAVRDLHAALDFSQHDTTPALARSAIAVRGALEEFLERAGSEPDPSAALAELETRLLGELPRQLDRLETALAAGPVTLQDLPADLVRRMQAPDGTRRVQILAANDLSDPGELNAFVDVVREVAPAATGIPVHIVEFGRATSRSLREALLVAGSAITLLLVVLWRRVRDPLRVLTVLTVGAVTTVGAMVVLGEPFNFANVIAIPLLLGVGVDSCVHIVERWRSGVGDDVQATTARAVVYSALTTLASFGTLALSSHQGIASLGRLLVIGMVLMTVASLAVLPALLRVGTGHRPRGASPGS